MSDILGKIKKCDENKPYIFVSYNNEDKEVVYRDVLEFQNRGFNVWVDIRNIDKTKDSWKKDAIPAIEEYECRLVVLYVSKNSLVSEPCLNEMKATRSEDTQKYHGEMVPFIAVDTMEIGNIIEYKNKLRSEINSTEKNKEIRRKKIDVLDEFIKVFFNNNNERDRVQPDVPTRRIPGHYYEDIVNCFPKETLIEEPVVVQAPASDAKKEEVQEEKKMPDVVNEPEIPETPEKKKHVPVNVKIGGEIPVVESYSASITKNMTLAEFESLFTDTNFALYLRNLRAAGGKNYTKQFVDYTMAAILRGCDSKAEADSARWKYCTYAVAKNVDMENPSLGASLFTWQSNSRKTVGIEGSGKLGPNSQIFEKLAAELTLGDVEQMFKDKKEGFDTKDNSVIERVFEALYNTK